ncbi:MAG: class 1 isoprenoid biosynthesis enzyme [Candidatus Thermoplasmatota archaeon]
MVKSPVEMSYRELNDMLDYYLSKENLPSVINYHAESINYDRRQRFRLLLRALYRLLMAQRSYMKYIKWQFRELRRTGRIYTELRDTGCLRHQRIYLYLSKIGLSDLIKHLGGVFNDRLFSSFTISTMLYDCAFDLSVCKHYLSFFDRFIMEGERIDSEDPYLRLFQDNVDCINQVLGDDAFRCFMGYVRIEHISQLMSIYQLSDKNISRESLLKITFAKGGISGLALMYLMVPHMGYVERCAIYELGAVMQLIDDIVDMVEDARVGISTLPNQRMLGYDELKGLYYGAVNNLIEKCGLDPCKPNGTLDMLCWFDDIILKGRYKKLFEGV